MKVGIVGLGLIGGSIGLDLRQAGGYTVLGVSRREVTCQQAIARGVVDDASSDLALLTGADLIILCTPLHALTSTVQQLLPYLSAQTILTDVGSVKAPVVEALAPLWPRFVGGHPMAGKAESGLEVAEAGLFVNKAYVVTPIESTPPDALETVIQLARSLQSQIYQCPPQVHDQAVAWISHLPVMVSASLIAASMGEADAAVLEFAQKFASSGFRDTSRVGGGTPELGMMMAQYNRVALLRSLQLYRQQLDQVIDQVNQERWSDLETLLHQTQQDRPKFVD